MQSVLAFLGQNTQAEIAEAHCDAPCGVYDPASARIAAESVYQLTKKIIALEVPNPNDKAAYTQYLNTVTRYILIKEEQSHVCKRELLILWTDFFKPEHLEKFPNLHDLFWKTAKNCSYCKVEVSLHHAEELLTQIKQIHEIFWKVKVTGRIQTFSEKQTTYYLVRNREGKSENEIIDEEEEKTCTKLQKEGVSLPSCLDLMWWGLRYYKPYRIKGSSMTPTLIENDLVLVNWNAYDKWKWNEEQMDGLVHVQDQTLYQTVRVLENLILPTERDVVLIRHPFMSDVTAVKRAEHISLQIHVQEDEGQVLVRARLFVLGDNPENSTDSRSYGAIPLKCLLGKVVAVMKASSA